jgi:hypothetical protein
MRTFTAYQCEFCNEVFKDEAICVSHEATCSYNCDNKSCDTCKHLQSEYGNFVCHQQGVYEYYDERLPNCPKWQLETRS